MSVDDPLDITPVSKPRLRRLRLLAILLALALLGMVSFVFGMFVSIASDLPSLTAFSQIKNAQSSELLDDLGHPIGVLSQQNRVIVTPNQIPRIVKEAVISIEDKRFETNGGVDIRGIARALLADVRHQGGVQGASTIEQQFIKNALQAQSHRTIFEKLREAALAYQLSHKWSKEKIITAYLNTIYFGNGAYGIEAAAQTYFGHEVNHAGLRHRPGTSCAWKSSSHGRRPCWRASSAPPPNTTRSTTRWPPSSGATWSSSRCTSRVTSRARSTKKAFARRCRPRKTFRRRRSRPSKAWTRATSRAGPPQQVVERYGAPRAFDGGLRIKTTLDLQLQKAAEQAISGYLSDPEGPSASLVAIENSTGEVRAMVGGRNYAETPFNLATDGERQPGSSFKAFDLAAALKDGISPYSEWTSAQKTLYYHGEHGLEKFVVHNDEGSYSGTNTLIGATAASDNSIFAEVGLKVGTKRIALLAHRMGITTPLSTNAAMTIGGLTVGVTPLDMAHAYETIAHNGQRVSGSMAEAGAPVGIQEVEAGGRPLPDGSKHDVNRVEVQQILPPSVAATETQMLETVIQYGTGKAAALGEFAAGKTGTTSNFGDAWFVGWNSKYTVAVWVGYPNKLVPMTTDFNGGPVFGGTFPALIWHDFLTSALQIDRSRAEQAAASKNGSSSTSTGTGTVETAAPQSTGTPQSGQSSTPAGGKTGGGETQAGQGSETKKEPAAPEKAAAPAPAQEAPATPAPSSGATGGAASPTGGVSPGG